MRQVDGLGPRPEDPDPTDGVEEQSQEQFDQARIDLEQAAAVHNAAVARATQLAETLVEAYDAEARAAESVSAWRRWALTSAAAATLTDTIDEVLANEVEPLAMKVGERWNTLFADRPDLRFDLDGDLWREFRGHRLGIDAFSAGEQMAARLLMQLAILTSATRVKFCWIDEPLEHLDPKTRRLVAGMLSHGRDALGLRQLVVTTYEEELAQRLSEADETTTVQYVRAGTGP
jgi:DNA repair exonuclease SbcCD ATPase subunit